LAEGSINGICFFSRIRIHNSPLLHIYGHRHAGMAFFGGSLINAQYSYLGLVICLLRFLDLVGNEIPKALWTHIHDIGGLGYWYF
jgi:hypothetical protein